MPLDESHDYNSGITTLKVLFMFKLIFSQYLVTRLLDKFRKKSIKGNENFVKHCKPKNTIFSLMAAQIVKMFSSDFWVK